MFTFLVIVIALIALFLVLLVLVQSGKGGGLAGIAAGGATTQILGARQAPDVLEKATWVLATLFVVLCILTNFVIDDGGQRESVIQQRAADAPVQTPGTIPQAAPGTPLDEAPEAGEAPAQEAPAQEQPPSQE